jgi:hypothetical protein
LRAQASSIPETPAPSPSARRTQLPKAWEPNGHLEQWAQDTLEEQAPSIRYQDQLDQFRDYWHGKGDTKSDWNAAFRVWVCESINRSKRNGITASQRGKIGGAERALFASEVFRRGHSQDADQRGRDAEPITVGSASVADEPKRSRGRNRGSD